MVWSGEGDGRDQGTIFCEKEGVKKFRAFSIVIERGRVYGSLGSPQNRGPARRSDRTLMLWKRRNQSNDIQREDERLLGRYDQIYAGCTVVVGRLIR
jgi:hypothetical protein